MSMYCPIISHVYGKLPVQIKKYLVIFWLFIPWNDQKGRKKIADANRHLQEYTPNLPVPSPGQPHWNAQALLQGYLHGALGTGGQWCPKSAKESRRKVRNRKYLIWKSFPSSAGLKVFVEENGRNSHPFGHGYPFIFLLNHFWAVGIAPPNSSGTFLRCRHRVHHSPMRCARIFHRVDLTPRDALVGITGRLHNFFTTWKETNRGIHLDPNFILDSPTLSLHMVEVDADPKPVGFISSLLR